MLSKVEKNLPSAIKVFKGVSIYRVESSKYWMVRIWNSETKKYEVKSTGETSAIKAREIAKDYARSIDKPKVDTRFTFKRYAEQLVKENEKKTENGEMDVGYKKAQDWALEKQGLIKWFGDKDVRKITTRDFKQFMDKKTGAASSKGTILATFRNVMKLAVEDAAIDFIPDTPRSKQKDNPRPFFRFAPIVDKKHDQYKKVLTIAKQMANENVIIRGNPVTGELYDLILFIIHSFVRPTTTELYAIKHEDVTVAENPSRLLVRVKDGKTGHRIANTMGGAVEVYSRILKRNPEYSKPDDYIFLPEYRNRKTASQIIQRQMRELLDRANFGPDPVTGTPHTIYSLRHTAICMRLVLSEGKVNIFNLAKNAGTSVDMIERFYAKHLPLSPELVRNLQTGSFRQQMMEHDKEIPWDEITKEIEEVEY